MRRSPAHLLVACVLSSSFCFAQSVPKGSVPPQLENIRLHVATEGATISKDNVTVTIDGQAVPVKAFAAPGATPPAEIDIIFDTVNQPYLQVEYAEEQIAKYLRTAAGKLAQPVAILIMTDTGTQTLAPAGTDGPALAQTMSKGFTSLRAIRNSAGLYGAVDRLDISLKEMNNLAAESTARPGHKVFLFVSHGWPLIDVPDSVYHESQKSIFASAVQLQNLLLAADATVYMVSPDNGSNDPGFRRFVYKSYEKPLVSPDKAMYADLALQVFAVHTGGLVFDSSNDVASEIAQSIADANATSTVVVAAPPSNGDRTTYRAISVQTPQGKARAATGYYDIGR